MYRRRERDTWEMTERERETKWQMKLHPRVVAVWVASCARVTHLTVIMRMNEEGERERFVEKHSIDQEQRSCGNQWPRDSLIMHEMCVYVCLLTCVCWVYFLLSYQFASFHHLFSFFLVSWCIYKHSWEREEASFALIWWHIYIKRRRRSDSGDETTSRCVSMCASHTRLIDTKNEGRREKRDERRGMLQRGRVDWKSVPSASDEHVLVE